MIFYYSGTGNSEYVAKELGRLSGDKTNPVYIPKVIEGEKLEVYDDGSIGFVFPIYSWGVPPIVLDFVERLSAPIFKDRYVWAVCTCGDETGNAMKHFDMALRRVGGKGLDLCASVIMPNAYVLLPGFKVDSPAVIDAKLNAAPKRVRELAELIKKRKKGVNDVNTGSMPAIRSLVYPFFRKWGINPGKWHFDSLLCISCGKCARICPVHNVKLNGDGHPVWGKNCLSCCGCFHVCPNRAIDYGKVTNDKKQYLFPGYQLPDK